MTPSLFTGICRRWIARSNMFFNVYCDVLVVWAKELMWKLMRECVYMCVMRKKCFKVHFLNLVSSWFKYISNLLSIMFLKWYVDPTFPEINISEVSSLPISEGQQQDSNKLFLPKIFNRAREFRKNPVRNNMNFRKKRRHVAKDLLTIPGKWFTLKITS